MVVHQTYLLNIKYFSSLLPNGSLLISCSGREEEGHYQCRATNSLDQITKTVSLDVQGRHYLSTPDSLPPPTTHRYKNYIYFTDLGYQNIRYDMTAVLMELYQLKLDEV